MQKKEKIVTKIAKNGARKPADKPAVKLTPSRKTIIIEPTHEDIARRAYEIYAARGTGGRELEDWVQAERELSRKNNGHN